MTFFISKIKISSADSHNYLLKEYRKKLIKLKLEFSKQDKQERLIELRNSSIQYLLEMHLHFGF